jgi:proline dehydrogenase
MLRKALLGLSERRGLQDFLMRRKWARGVARRFVAGATLDEAIAAVRDLNARGMRVTLDHLGESVTSPAAAEAAAADYVEILGRIGREGVDSGISIKPTQLGLAIDEDLCLENLRRVAEAACRHERFVRIDMEHPDYVEPTLRVFRRLHGDYGRLGVVIQSYLRRSEADVRELCATGAPVRLCKGAYSADDDIAFQKKDEIDASFVRLLELLIDCGAPLAVATHDDAMIEAARRLRDGSDRRDGSFEFQMLYGVRRDLQAALVEEGYRMRIYVPYGTEWYPYFMRRMAERPANFLFVLRALVGG